MNDVELIKIARDNYARIKLINGISPTKKREILQEIRKDIGILEKRIERFNPFIKKTKL